MKSLILYSSLSGNTEKVARAIASEIEDAELLAVHEFHTQMAANFDVFYLGYWVDKGDCDAKIKKVMEVLEKRRIVLFGTLGAAENTAYYDMVKARVEAHANNNDILAHFLCQGKVNDSLIERYKEMLKKNPDDEHMIQQVANYEQGSLHPDEKDLANAREFARSIA